MDFESLLPKKPHIGIDIGPLMPRKRKQLMLRQKFLKQNGSLLLVDVLKNGVGSIQIFRAEEIEKATMNFSYNMIIGKGGSGTVYKGILPDTRVVAIKRSKISDEAHIEEFINEIAILGRINHKNMVQLLGCCLETEVPLLVYEFVSNHTLFYHIHDYTRSTSRLSWDSRLRIAHESAGALAYLHTDATMTIIHRDVKTANILLDENYTAKVADFGTSGSLQSDDDCLTTKVIGTLGYVDPEYLQSSKLTDKSDVYSFGVVLAELITGSKPLCWERGLVARNLAIEFVNAKREDRLNEIIDPQVFKEAITNVQLEAACSLVYKCLRLEGANRPSMREVAMELERIRKIKMHPEGNEENDESLND